MLGGCRTRGGDLCLPIGPCPPGFLCGRVALGPGLVLVTPSPAGRLALTLLGRFRTPGVGLLIAVVVPRSVPEFVAQPSCCPIFWPPGGTHRDATPFGRQNGAFWVLKVPPKVPIFWPPGGSNRDSTPFGRQNGAFLVPKVPPKVPQTSFLFVLHDSLV